MIKIIGGEYKGSKLEVPQKNVRPTSVTKRKSIFSIIESYALKNSTDLYKNKAILDIFAGSGSVGLEAISRGITEAIFYENDIKIKKVLKQNCKKICKKNNYKIIENNVMRVITKKNSLPVSIIFIDPPYYKYDIQKILIELIKEKVIETKTIIIIESHLKEKISIPNEFKIFDKRLYGKTLVYFLKLLT